MGNKNNYNANNFMQVGYQNNGGWNDGKNCDKDCNDDVMAISSDKGCGCGNNYDNDVMATGNNDYGQCNVGGLRDIRMPE